MKQKIRIVYGWIIILLLTGLSGCSTSLEVQSAGGEHAIQLGSSGLIDQNMAIFSPEGFIPEETLPSFALIKEPIVSRDIPENWELIPEYYTRDGVQGVRVSLPSGTSVYGTGEVTGPLLRNGSHVSLWNTDNFAYSKWGGKQLYQSHPWVLGVRDDGTAFGLLADSSWKMSVFLGDSIDFFSEGPSFRTLVIEGENPEEVLIRLGELTGKMELPPLWAIGYHQCRYSYYPDDQVLEIASTFREKQIPADVIWLDIHYMDEFRVFTFDPIYFRNPSEMNTELHDENFKTIWMIDPGIKVEPGYEIYDEGSAGDHWVKTAEGVPYIGEVWPGECVFPDFTRPETREWWSGLYADFMANGIDGVWNDMNEPAVFHVSSGTMPENNVHRGGGGLPAGSHLRYHNVYGMLMIQATREGIADYAPGKRPFVLTRANYLGGQRFGATWTGDNASNWNDLRLSIPMSLNLGLSGQPFNGPDIGGFAGNATPDLYGHWIALGAFYPFSRGHTIHGSIPHEPWAFGEDIEEVARTALNRRYRLLPYLYTQFHHASETNLPIMRPVFFADFTDISLRSEEQAFLIGPDLLIVPQWAEDPRLPGGLWKAVSLAEEDPQNDPYQPVVRQRGGSIVPLGEIIQSTAHYTDEALTLLVCLDENERAVGTLYDDEGEGFGYLEGNYSVTEFEAIGENGSLRLMVRRTRGERKIDDRRYRIVLITGDGTTVTGDWQKGEVLTLEW